MDANHSPADAKQVVNDLRSFCQGHDQGKTAAVERLAEAYAALCNQANRRLRHCDELVHKGLRAEAIQIAEEAPPLLDLVAKLQFAELPAWEEVAGRYGLAAPPRLLLPSAEALNRAYTEYGPLKGLMKDYRRLALSRAPVAERLEVLRKLADEDPANPAWQDDLAAVEEARQRELRAEVEAAFAQRQEKKAHELLHELIESPWRLPLVMEVVKPIMTQYLEVLARGLQESVQRGNVTQARRLLTQWAGIAPVAELPPTHPLARRAEAAQKMVDRKDKSNARELQFQTALKELEDALRDGAPPEELQDLHAAAAEFGRPIPAALEEFYLDRLHTIHLKNKNFEAVVLGSTFVGGTILLIGLIIFLVTR
jgi:hypothetical protein